MSVRALDVQAKTVEEHVVRRGHALALDRDTPPTVDPLHRSGVSALDLAVAVDEDVAVSIGEPADLATGPPPAECHDLRTGNDVPPAGCDAAQDGTTTAGLFDDCHSGGEKQHR